jgi:hypothetical protein
MTFPVMDRVRNSFEAFPGFEGLPEGERLMLGPKIQGVPKSCSFISIKNIFKCRNITTV